MQDASSPDLLRRLNSIKTLVEETIELLQGRRAKLSQAGRNKTNAEVIQEKGKNEIDFSKPIRPFIKQYGAEMSGPKKFTLLLAYLAGGDLDKKISLIEVQNTWGRMTSKSLLGLKFNRFYSSHAKDSDWVNTEKNGLYYLRPSWKEIFNEGR